jgi:serine/threonine-protein kinase
VTAVTDAVFDSIVSASVISPPTAAWAGYHPPMAEVPAPDDTCAAVQHDETVGEAETVVVPDPVPTQAADLAWSAATETESDHPPPASTRRVAVIGAVILLLACGAAAAVVVFGRTPPKNADRPHVAAASPSPTRGPLNGTFRVDRYRGQGVIHAADGSLHAPGAATATVETEWWAYSSSCLQGICTATGTRLDYETHQRPMVNNTGLVTDELSKTMRLVNGQWLSHPNTAQQPCIRPPGQFDTWQWTVTLTPLADGTLKGEEVDRIITDECHAIGTVVNTPIGATRVGDVPPGMARAT